MEPVSTLLGICIGQAFDLTKDLGASVGEVFADDKVKSFAKTIKQRLKTHLPLPKNHDLVREIRRAELVAARRVERAYRKWLDYLPEYEKSREQMLFAAGLDEFLSARLKLTNGGIDFQALSQERIDHVLDEMIDVVVIEGAASGAAESRRKIEAAFLDEIAREADCKIPPDFDDFFAGTHPSINPPQGGWYDIVALYITEEIKENERFKSIFFATELVDIKRLLNELNAKISALQKLGASEIRDEIREVHRIAIDIRIDGKATRQGVERLEERFARLEAALNAAGFSEGLSKEIEAERDKYKMTVEAAIKEISRVSTETVSPDNLIGVLGAVFTQYQAVKEALTRPANDSGKIKDRKQQAVAALDAGDLEQAESILREILAQERREADEKRSDWLAAVMRQAESYAMLGRVALARRNVADAAGKYQAGADELAAADSQTRWSYTFAAAEALQGFGDAAGQNDALEAAIHFWKAALGDAPRDRVPLDWAMTQNNLGNALSTLGERERGKARLEDALAAYRAALEEYTRDRVPLNWATTQNNLGNALHTLGQRESGTARLEEAVAAYRAALEERTRDRVPLDWATTKNNLGTALRTLGERECGTARLEEAVAAYRAALEEYTQDRVPLQWAGTQNNLSIALATLKERESGAARL